MTTCLAPTRAAAFIPKRAERRAFPRRQAKGSASYHDSLRPSAKTAIAVLTDISQSGIGMVVRERLFFEQWLTLQLLPRIDRPLAECQCQVRWVTAQDDGTYRVGCCFEHRLNYSDLQKFV